MFGKRGKYEAVPTEAAVKYKKKSAKSNLLSAYFTSLLCLILCATMFMSTSMAWFTSEVNNAGNQIYVGLLDVKLLHEDEGEWYDIEQNSGHRILDWNLRWEPNGTYIERLQVQNDGDLAFNYRLGMSIKYPENADFDKAKAEEAAKYISVYVTKIPENATYEEPKDLTEIEQNWTKVGSLSEIFAGKLVLSGAMGEADVVNVNNGVITEVGTIHEYAVAFHMDAKAPSSIMGAQLKDINVKLVAAQLAAENDVFGRPDYDEDAIYYDKLATTDKELKAALEDPTAEVIAIDGDLVYDWGGDSNENSKALLMKGKVLRGFDGNDSITFKGYGSANPITDVTLVDITVKDETVGDNENAWEHGHLEFVGVNANNVTFANSIMVSGNSRLTNCNLNNTVRSWYGLWINGGNVTIENCSFTGTRAVKIHEAYGTEVGTVVINNNTFANLSEKPGVVIGDLNSTTTVALTNNVFAGTQPGDQNNYMYESDTDVNTFNFTEKDNKVAEYAGGNAELDAAITAGESTIVLGAGNYIIPDTAQGKTLTIIGNGDTVVATQDDGSYEGCDYSLDGATVTFENITINTDSSTYTGYARLNATYKNCTINGTYTLYGESVFENCTFNVSGDYYNIWTWGAPAATFNNCTFNSDGKALLLYGQANTKLIVDSCVFNDNGELADLKAAIEIGNDYDKSYELIVKNTVVNGYEINDKGIPTGTTLWANKNSMGTDKLNVVVDGVDVY